MTGMGGHPVIDAVLAATRPVEQVPATFALQVRPGQDPVRKAAEIAAAFASAGGTVGPLSAIEHRVLLLRLPGRVWADPTAAFAAGYALADGFDLAAAEPDLPTAFYPELESVPPDPAVAGVVTTERAGDAGDVELESVGGLLGCWAPAEPELAANPSWALDTINARQAWAFSDARQRPSRGQGVVVAQPDTGITAHAELAGVVTVAGYDVLDGDPDPTDPLERSPGANPGHGTGTASVLVSPGSLTVVGSAPAATHMPIRAIRSVVRISQVSVAQAIDYAVEHGAQVITMSLGGIPSFSLYFALRRAVEADVIVLAAAGNCVGTVVWPARYADCIAVGGTDRHDQPWVGSCHGPAVDVSAPGQNVYKAGALPATAEQGQGTSFAVALTAGVAALWIAHHGRANLIAAARGRGETLQAMFRRLVVATARVPGPNWDPTELGAGVVDAQALLAADFDQGLDQESVQLEPGSAAQAELSVRSLIAEVAEPEAAIDDLDWERFGPEIAHSLLTGRAAGPELEGVHAGGPMVSPELGGAVANPALRGLLGLDPHAGGVPE